GRARRGSARGQRRHTASHRTNRRTGRPRIARGVPRSALVRLHLWRLERPVQPANAANRRRHLRHLSAIEKRRRRESGSAGNRRARIGSARQSHRRAIPRRREVESGGEIARRNATALRPHRHEGTKITKAFQLKNFVAFVSSWLYLIQRVNTTWPL